MEENTERPIILFEHTDICASGNLVISDLNMSIMPGEFVYIIGKVGSGKTSIIRTIIGENPVTKGNAVVGGFNLRKLKNRQIPYLRRKIGVVFQDFQLLMERSVYDNLRFDPYTTTSGSSSAPPAGRTAATSTTAYAGYWPQSAWSTRRTICLTSCQEESSRE